MAARPVGANNTLRHLNVGKVLDKAATILVFPVPAYPLMTIISLGFWLEINSDKREINSDWSEVGVKLSQLRKTEVNGVLFKGWFKVIYG